MPRQCQIGRLFHRCHEAAIATCQYCGRDFCQEHAGLRVDTEEICSREICLEKHEDLKAHMIYRAAAIDRSNRGFCGVEDCTEPRSGQCSKCHALYCDRHLRDREESIRQGMITLKRPVSLCDHCAARLKLWSRL